MVISILPQTALATLTPLSDFAASYDGLRCDIWGVLHNGVAAFDDAVDALCRYRAQGGIVILITNAPGPILKSTRNWNVLVSSVGLSMQLSHQVMSR
jgi:ribonucleotide monophosphatase NagD (HAD superfamily)